MKGNAHAEPASRQPPPTMALPLPQNKQKVRFGKKCVLRNVKNEGASGDVYENKGSRQNVMREILDMSAQLRGDFTRNSGGSRFILSCVVLSGRIPEEISLVQCQP